MTFGAVRKQNNLLYIVHKQTHRMNLDLGAHYLLNHYDQQHVSRNKGINYPKPEGPIPERN